MHERACAVGRAARFNKSVQQTASLVRLSLMNLEREMRSDAELVMSTLRGDRESFGSLVERHRRAVLACALQRGLQPAEAEDATQETFIKAFHALGGLNDPSYFGRWLHGIAAHVSSDYSRARHRRRERTGMADDSMPNESADPAPGVRGGPELDGVLRALGELPEEHRVVITLRYLDGLSPKEIAERLHEPRGTIRSRLHHALTYLQVALGGRTAREKRRSVRSAAVIPADDSGATPPAPAPGSPDGSGGAP